MVAPSANVLILMSEINAIILPGEIAIRESVVVAPLRRVAARIFILCVMCETVAVQRCRHVTSADSVSKQRSAPLGSQV